jgi:DNA-binding MarR family transcriptional regulator
MAASRSQARSSGVAGADEGQRREQEIRELGLAFRHVFRALGRIRGRDTHLAPGELSHAQYELLIELYERGELSAGELAQAARLSPATVTQMLEALTESGHVERTRSDSDRRVVTARLTALGAARIEAKRDAWKSRWKAALEDFSERDLRAAREVLQRLGDMLELEPAKGSPQSPAGEPE